MILKMSKLIVGVTMAFVALTFNHCCVVFANAATEFKSKLVFAPTTAPIELVWHNPSTDDELEMVFAVAGDGIECGQEELELAEASIDEIDNHQHLHNGGTIRPPSVPEFHLTSISSKTYLKIAFPNDTCTAMFSTKPVTISKSPIAADPAQRTIIWLNNTETGETYNPVHVQNQYSMKMLFAPTIDPIELVWHGASTLSKALDLVFTVAGNGINCGLNDLIAAEESILDGDISHQHLHNGGTIQPPSYLDVHLSSVPERTYFKVAFPNNTCTAVFGTLTVEQYNISFLNARTNETHAAIAFDVNNTPIPTSSPSSGLSLAPQTGASEKLNAGALAASIGIMLIAICEF